MEHIGIDVHKRTSQVCICTEDGELAERKIATARETFTRLLGSRPRSRIVIEASTESEWVARSLEALGPAVIVADPNSAPMYASRSRKVKTDRRLEEIVKNDEVAQRLQTVPSVGPVTVVTFLATLDHVERFDNAGQVRAYLGLVPREHRSGERQMRGRITKAGNSRLRCLLVEAAWGILRRPRPDTEALRGWTERIATRRGKRIAVVALARKLAGILYAMWRDGTQFGEHAAPVKSVAA